MIKYNWHIKYNIQLNYYSIGNLIFQQWIFSNCSIGIQAF